LDLGPCTPEGLWDEGLKTAVERLDDVNLAGIHLDGIVLTMVSELDNDRAITAIEYLVIPCCLQLLNQTARYMASQVSSQYPIRVWPKGD